MNSVLAFAKTRPLVFSIGFTSFKTGLADFVTQTQIEKRETLDVKRNATFWLFGAWFLGGVQYGVYVKLFSRLFPRAEAFALLPLREKLRDTAGQATVVKQVALDMLVWEPFFYFPTFYQTKFWVQGRDPLDAWRTYCRNISSDIVDMWRFGVPAFFFNFTFCPMWARVPFVGLYSLFWTMYLSFQRGSEGSTEPQTETPRAVTTTKDDEHRERGAAASVADGAC